MLYSASRPRDFGQVAARSCHDSGRVNPFWIVYFGLGLVCFVLELNGH